MKKSLLSFLVFLIVSSFLSGCGGGSSTPPLPTASNGTISSEVKAADTALTKALDQCNSGFQSLGMPSFFSSNSVGQPLGGGNPNNSSSGIKPSFLPLFSQGSACVNDLTTAMLLWKSAPAGDGVLAIQQGVYQKYLFDRIASYLNQIGLKTGLPLDRQRMMAELAKNQFSTALLQQKQIGGLGLQGQDFAMIQNGFSFGAGNVFPQAQSRGIPQITTPSLGNSSTLLNSNVAAPVANSILSSQVLKIEDLQKAKGYGLSY